MERKVKLKKCKRKECDVSFQQFNSLQPYCSFECKKLDNQNKPKKEKKIYKIPRRSEKRAKEEKIYSAKRIVFLAKKENSICPVTKQKAIQVHHKKGRIGDLLLDERFWLGVSDEGHKKIEANPEWAKEQGYSLSRTANG